MKNQELIRIVATEYGLTPDDLFKPTRVQPIAEARQMSMYVLHTQSRLNKTTISTLFNKSFSAVHYAIDFIESLISVDKSIRGRHERIIASILES